MEELKPCPFCGSEAKLQKDERGGIWAECTDEYCGCSLDYAGCDNETSRKHIIEQWNTRAERTCKPSIVEKHIKADGEEFSFWQAICDCGNIVGEDGTPNLEEFECIDNYCSECGAKVVQ